MGKGLSELQWFILLEAYKNRDGYPAVTNADILIKWYGFEPAYSYRAIKFNRHQIGMKRYLSASAAVARSLTRLRDRGFMTRGYLVYDHCLTEKGAQVVEKFGQQQVHNG
ncbi:hypothetical protein [Desulfobacula sp.]|uniref:hypothetical protein n=1 Tax=Desulfobacula sp. TaxID=2593537 RepID=UPI002636B241|nr:hypothetical protein [Desulfobacula sp.]